MPRVSRLYQFLILLVISILLASCETVSYYSQAARGQMAIVFSRQDIQRLLDDSKLTGSERQRFEQVLAIRDFAARELALPVGKHFSTYVDIEREHVVWNVFAAPEFSTDPVSWCYPIAGCVTYRGYFSEAGAKRFAGKLVEQGYDVYTGGVDAYSTLGWFEDSLLSTVIERQSFQLAGLIFHELAHQVIYVPGDTTFNESFATAVEREGIRRWLHHSGQEDQIELANRDTLRQEQFVALISDYQGRFTQLYAQPLAAQTMRSRKAQLQHELRKDYELLKEQWQGYNGYDTWFARSLNNAQLATVSAYNDLVPGFMALLDEAGWNFPEFYERVREISLLPQEQREALLGTEL